MTKSRALSWAFAGVLSVVFVAALVYKTWPILFPEVVAVAKLDPNCDLRSGVCKGYLPAGEVSFGIEPRSIPVLEPLTLVVLLAGIESQGVEVDFAGTDMNMGFNRVTLHQETPGVWKGQGMLPVCVRDVMSWEAKILIRTQEGLTAAPFRFDTYRSRKPD